MAKNPFARIARKQEKEERQKRETTARLKHVYKQAGNCKYCGEQLPNHTGQCPVVS